MTRAAIQPTRRQGTNLHATPVHELEGKSGDGLGGCIKKTAVGNSLEPLLSCFRVSVGRRHRRIRVTKRALGAVTHIILCESGEAPLPKGALAVARALRGPRRVGEVIQVRRSSFVPGGVLALVT